MESNLLIKSGLEIAQILDQTEDRMRHTDFKMEERPERSRSQVVDPLVIGSRNLLTTKLYSSDDFEWD